jgi:cellulose synthase operon protein C
MGIDRSLLSLLRRALLAVCLPALMLSGCDESPEERAEAQLKAGQERLSRGDLAGGLIDLKNVVQADPQNAEGRRLLGEVHFQLGDFPSAEKELALAWDLGLQTPEVRLLLTQALLGQEKYVRVVSETTSEAEPGSPVARDLLVARGDALLGLGRLQEAEQHFLKVIDIAPQASAYAGLARVAFARRDYEKALSLLGMGIELSPADPQLHAMAGSLHAALQQESEAEAALKRALDLDADNYIALVNLAKLRIQQRDFELAGALVDRLIEVAGQRISIMTLKSYVALALDDYQAADRWSMQVLAHDRANPTALYVSGAAAFALNQLERAHSRLTQYLNYAPDDSSALVMLRETVELLAKGSIGQAPSTSDRLSHVSLAALDAGDIRARRLMTEALAVQTPHNPRLRAHLSMERAAIGDLRRAKEELSEALELDAGPEHQSDVDRAATTLILSYIERQNHGAAIQESLAFQKRRPDLPTPYSLLAMSYLGAGQFVSARNVLEEGLQKFPGSIELLGNLTALETRAGNIDQAIAASERLIAANGEHYPTLLRLSGLSLRIGDNAAAKSWARRAIDASPEVPTPKVLLARLFLAENNHEEALKILSALRQSFPDDLQVLTVLGEALIDTGRQDEAIATLEALTAKAPDSVGAHYLLARAYGLGGESEGMVHAFDKALEIDPYHYRTLVAYSRYLMRENKLDDAEGLVGRLERDADGNPEVTKLAAELALLQSNYPAAIQKFEAAQTAFAKGGVFDQSISVNLSNAYWESGARDKSVEVLQKWLAHEADDPLVRLKLASRLSAEGQHEEAAEEFARVIALEPDNWIARNQFALLLQSQGSLDAARSQAETAVQQSGRNPLVMDTFGTILLAHGDSDGAVAALDEAHRKLPEVPALGLHLSQALAAAGRQQDARKVLDKYLSQSAAFAERGEMERLRSTLN